MAIDLNDIRKPISKELVLFEERFREAMKSNAPLLDAIMRYVVKSKGKRMRPMFVLLAAKTCGTVNDSTYHAAALIELLHTATIVHDDVVDDAHQRRGFFSINALWKNKIAVLVGDYLLAKGLLLAISNGEYRLLEIVSEAVRQMSEGELLQVEKSRVAKTDEESYYHIIRGKTASLIASACAGGAASVKTSEESIGRMKSFGENVGMAFQIKDDLLDFGSDETGKPHGMDLKEKKMTLPVIYSLQEANGSDRRKMLSLIRRPGKNKNAMHEMLALMNAHGGLHYAEKKMKEYQQKAMDILALFPQSDARQSLEWLVDFTVNRNH